MRALSITMRGRLSGNAGRRRGADLDDARLGERGMHRVGGGQELERRAHADAVVLAFDRGGADHETVAGARHDVERPARMDQAHRARQRDLAGLDNDDLALHAAQVGAHVARGQPAAVDHGAVEILRLRRGVEFNSNTRGAQPLVQFGQRTARLDVAFIVEEQRCMKTAGEIGFQASKLGCIDMAVPVGKPAEALEVGAVARMRDDEGTVERRLRGFATPQIERAQAEPCHQRFRRLALAIRRQHSTGPVAHGLRHRRVAALVQRDLAACFRKQQRLPGAGDAGADHADRCRRLDR